MVLIMVVSMTACGSSKEKADPSTPTGGATVFLDALKAKDKDKLKDSYAGDSKQLLSAMGDMGASSSADKTEKALVKKMEEKIYDFDYEIKNSLKTVHRANHLKRLPLKLPRSLFQKLIR